MTTTDERPEPTGDPVLDELRGLAAARLPTATVRPGLACVNGPGDVVQTYKVISQGGVPLAIGTAKTVRPWLRGHPVKAPEPPPQEPEPEPDPAPPDPAQQSLF